MKNNNFSQVNFTCIMENVFLHKMLVPKSEIRGRANVPIKDSNMIDDEILLLHCHD